MFGVEGHSRHDSCSEKTWQTEENLAQQYLVMQQTCMDYDNGFRRPATDKHVIVYRVSLSTTAARN